MLGSALMTAIYFDVAKAGTGVHAMEVTVIVVVALIAVCLLLGARLLPHRAAGEA